MWTCVSPEMPLAASRLHLDECITTDLVIRGGSFTVGTRKLKRHGEAHQIAVEILRLRVVLDADADDQQPGVTVLVVPRVHGFPGERPGSELSRLDSNAAGIDDDCGFFMGWLCDTSVGDAARLERRGAGRDTRLSKPRDDRVHVVGMHVDVG